ncbi:MAG: hypothetical protein AAF135_26305, partial [Bacteroidota bacterium]
MKSLDRIRQIAIKLETVEDTAISNPNIITNCWTTMRMVIFNLFWWILLLMFLEHFIYYRWHYVNKQEYNNTGVLNEGLN